MATKTSATRVLRPAGALLWGTLVAGAGFAQGQPGVPTQPGDTPKPPTPSMDGIRAEVTAYEEELGRLESEYHTIPEIRGESRFNDYLFYATGAYENKEYEISSLYFYGAVEPPLPEPGRPASTRPEFALAIKGLADSLYKLENYGGARTHYERLLNMPSNQFRDHALVRLIDIASTLRDTRSVQNYVRIYEAQGQSRNGTPSEVSYALGRMYFLAGEMGKSKDRLVQIPPGDAYYLRAQYLIGANLVKEGKLVDGLRQYDTILRTVPPVADADPEVRELCHLARGRLYYELDKYDEAVDAYNYIDVDSDYLATMLYEVIWTYVRRAGNARTNTDLEEKERQAAADKEYESALERLQVLDYLESETDLEADIKILMGNLQIQRRAFPEATSTFASVLGLYGPADDELRLMVEDPVARQQLLRDILTLEQGGLAAETKLPRLAAERAKQNTEVAKALSIYRELDRSKAEIVATQKLLSKLEQRLNQPDRAGLFKEVASPLVRAKANKTNLLKAEAKVLDVKRVAARLKATDEQKLRMASLAARTNESRDALERITSDEESIKAERGAREGQLRVLSERMSEVRVLLQGVKAQVRAVDGMISRAKQQSNASPLEVRNLRKELAFFNQNVRALEAEQEAIDEEIRDMRDELKLTAGRGVGDTAVRQAFEQAARDENTLLNEILGPEAAKFAAIEARLADMKRRNQTFIDRVEAVVQKRVKEFQGAIATERSNLDDYRRRVASMEADAAAFRDTATAIALEHVRAVLGQVVIRADVGLVDVAWARKQAETEKIAELQRARQAELTDLNQAYADLTQDEVN